MTGSGVQRRAVARHSGVWLLVVSTAAGLCAAWAMHRYIEQKIESIEARTRVVAVPRLVAAINLEPGDVLNSEHVAQRDVPQEWALADALRPEDLSYWEGVKLSHPVHQGEQFLPSVLGPVAEVPLAARLAPGRRAVTISVDDISSQAGMLEPGNHLDIYITLDRVGQRATALLLHSVVVLAVGQRASQVSDDDQHSFSTVTLDVTESEAVRLVAARQSGTLSAILLHEDEVVSDDKQVVLSTDLQVALGLRAAPAATPPKEIPVLYGADQGAASLQNDRVMTDAMDESW